MKTCSFGCPFEHQHDKGIDGNREEDDGENLDS